MSAKFQLAGGHGPNYVAFGDGFYVSYLKNIDAIKAYSQEPVIALANAIVANGESMEGDEETALCKDGQFFILNGDFREEYSKLIPQGFEACKKFFKSQQEHVSMTWSDFDGQES